MSIKSSFSMIGAISAWNHMSIFSLSRDDGGDQSRDAAGAFETWTHWAAASHPACCVVRTINVDLKRIGTVQMSQGLF